jgi:protein-disulfide isomerase
VPDLAAFRACLDGAAAALRVKEDIAAGDRLGVSGTPTVLVGSMRFRGTPSFAQLDSVIGKALAR